MQLTINIDEQSDKAKKLFRVLDELGISYLPKALTAKDAAFGIGRKATDAEIDEYLDRCMKGNLTSIDDI
jgi:hypothetical protein